MTSITDLSTPLSAGVAKVGKDINTISNSLISGKAALNPVTTGQVTRLSSQAAQYKSTATSLGQAQNVINIAQTGLTSAISIIQQMQDLANQSSSGTLSSTDMSALDVSFQALASQIALIGTNASVNGQNLLASSTGFSIMAGITTASTVTIGGIDLVTLGAAISTTLSITSSSAASSAVTSLTSHLLSISNGQSSLSASTLGITAYTSEATSLSTGLQQTIDSIQNIDPTALQAQLQQLNTQQSIDFYLVTQMNQAAAAVLTIFR